MKDEKELKKIVKDKYGALAREADTGESCGCGCDCWGQSVESWAVDLAYKGTEGYVPEADLNLGCGLPIKHAGIKPGDTVVDLGSGAGNDVFIARRIVGRTGKVIGVDMTPEMIDKARKNNAKLDLANVEFRLGEIENLPIENGATDVVVSNCVLNLVPDKDKAFSEIFRILKPGGHFCISDIVLKGKLPEKLKKSPKCIRDASPAPSRKPNTWGASGRPASWASRSGNPSGSSFRTASLKSMSTTARLPASERAAFRFSASP